MARVADRARRTFARLENVLELPNLLDIQRKSFEWLVDTEKGGLRETIDDVSPIEDYTGNLAVVFGDGRALDEVRRIALDTKAKVPQRQAALETLLEARPDDLKDI